MKHLLIILITLLSVNVSIEAQITKSDVTWSTSTTNQSGRIAIPNEKRDTLYVVTNMAEMFTTIWEDPKLNKERPVIIAVKPTHIDRLVAMYKHTTD